MLHKIKVKDIVRINESRVGIVSKDGDKFIISKPTEFGPFTSEMFYKLKTMKGRNVILTEVNRENDTPIVHTHYYVSHTLMGE